MRFVDKFFELFEKPCNHANRDIIQYIENNTPMIIVRCLDCDLVLDKGHVYGDTVDWEGVWRVRGGRTISKRELTSNDIFFTTIS